MSVSSIYIRDNICIYIACDLNGEDRYSTLIYQENKYPGTLGECLPGKVWDTIWDIWNSCLAQTSPRKSVTSYFLLMKSHPIHTWPVSTDSNSPRSLTIYVAYLVVSGSKLLELRSLFFQHFMSAWTPPLMMMTDDNRFNKVVLP